MTVWGHGLHAADVKVMYKPASISTLDAAWAWAVKRSQEKKDKDFYIGYSIMRHMNPHSYTGRIVYDNSDLQLSELIYNKKLPGPAGLIGKTIAETARRVLENSDENKHEHEKGLKVWKELAFIFRFHGDTMDCRELYVSNMELSVDFDANGPLYWLGKTVDNQSIPFLIQYYRTLGKQSGARLTEPDLIDMKERLITALAMHEDKKRTFGFLKDVLTGTEPDDVREKAAFWIGESQMPGAPKLLLTTANSDRSEDVREKAVFGLYLHRSKEADDGIINLAKHGKERNIRKKAIFWLGQKAVKRSAEILNQVVDDDKDRKIQNAAVFALSQLKDGEGVSSLIRIAKNHNSLAVRKKAIFWLSQSDDPRALDTIINLIQQ